MIQEEVRTSSDDNHIVYLSFELLENKVYRASENLYSFLESRIVDEDFYYIFLDEIQFVEDWPEVVNSIKTKHRNVSIFLTGSNSKLLDDDKESVLGGRTISFRIMPFTFAEFHEFRARQGASQDLEREFTEYMKWGGFPLIFAEENDSQKQIMLESIFDSIVLRDIVRRKKLKSSLELEHLIDYLIASSSSYISGRNICNRLARNGTSLSLPKILEFIKAADESCIVDIVPRYDVVGLQTVEFNNKSYTCDPAFINYKRSLVSDLYGVLYETIVYNDLIACGYTVRTGYAHGKEIDFIATKGNGERIYIQVAYEISEKNREREFGNFSFIKDNYPKYVVSRDRVHLSENGIIHMNIIDFLLRPVK
jgi:predicted AAA+ superfamily ATPase